MLPSLFRFIDYMIYISYFFRKDRVLFHDGDVLLAAAAESWLCVTCRRGCCGGTRAGASAPRGHLGLLRRCMGAPSTVCACSIYDACGFRTIHIPQCIIYSIDDKSQWSCTRFMNRSYSKHVIMLRTSGATCQRDRAPSRRDVRVVPPNN